MFWEVRALSSDETAQSIIFHFLVVSKSFHVNSRFPQCTVLSNRLVEYDTMWVNYARDNYPKRCERYPLTE